MDPRASIAISTAEFLQALNQEDHTLVSCDPVRKQEIAEAESYLKSLQELTYHVTKINQRGRHQSRILRISSKGIENVRATEASSIYKYSQVKSVALRNQNTFVLQYEGASHDYIYRSPVAMQVTHEISTRIELYRKTEKMKKTYELALAYQQQKLKNLKDSAAVTPPKPIPPTMSVLAPPIDLSSTLPVEKSSATSTPSSSLSSSSPEPATNVVVVGSGSVGGGSGEYNTLVSSSPNLSDSLSSLISDVSCGEMSSSPKSDAEPNESEKSRPSTSPALTTTETTTETTTPAKSQIEAPMSPSLPTSPSSITSPTKRATKVFRMLGANLVHCIDEIIWNQTGTEGKSINQFLSEFHHLMKNCTNALTSVRKFTDTLKTHVLSMRGAEFEKLVAQDPNPNQIVQVTLEKCLERCIITRLQKSIGIVLWTEYGAVDQVLNKNLSLLKGRPQEFFGIPPELRSVNNFSAGILEMSSLSRAEIPAEKLAIVLSTAKAIYKCVEYERSNNILPTEKKDALLSADDFLPIFIYIVINSEIKDLESMSQYIWLLGDPDQLTGEGGYYMTVFSSVISLLKNLDMSQLATAESFDNIIKADFDDDLNKTSDKWKKLKSFNRNVYSMKIRVNAYWRNGSL
eukprot:TRINITY_DN4864_c0_g1_i1.p1 TRINITY_DN4864_c0_g1~~TRINITY_DN4864_c0_g1_i1.p1  ORF type:complete len:630 (+),score=127.50 TRINITY_DN4864_c0_g1_i1:156-2045(+)